jgi:hypothetical protein
MLDLHDQMMIASIVASLEMMVSRDALVCSQVVNLVLNA